MKRVLILGSTGFIGKNLFEYFEKKYLVKAPTRKELDVLNENAIYEYLKNEKIDIILNALDIRCADDSYVEKRLRMFSNLEKYKDMYEKMIYFGSGAEYARELPIISINEEKFDRKIPEDGYGFCLRQMSKATLKSNNIYNLRLFGIFGKYEIWQQRFISNAICKALYNMPITIRQNVVFDYLHIDDLCEIVEWMMNETPKYHDYNAVSGKKYELTELAEIVKKVTKKEVPIIIAKGGFGKEYTASNKRLKEDMKEFNSENMEISIEKLSKWYQMNLNSIEKEKLI